MFLSWLRWSGSSFQVFEAYGRYLKEFNPYRVVLTVRICAVLLYLKLYLLFVKVTRSCRYWGVSLFIILNVSITIVRIGLIFKEDNFDLARSSSYVEWFSLYINLLNYCMIGRQCTYLLSVVLSCLTIVW